MHCESQYTSAPICITGIFRYAPVSGRSSGLGMMLGCSTARHDRPFRPNVRRTFSLNGDCG